MRRTIMIATILIGLLFLVESKSIVNLGGRDGNSLLSDLTNNSTSNSSINLTKNASFLHLGGENGTQLFNDITNASKNLSDWGSKPPNAPLPPGYDPRSAQTYEVLRMNHLGY